MTISELNYLKEQNKLTELKQKLPEGFLQICEWTMSYKILRNISQHRINYRLPHWKKFFDLLIPQLFHSEFLSS